ncbi:MAG: adenosylcobinamide-GDP ribazoletransferase [Chloroflexi bacterium]|nr:adenosylcobinamide-GDP ribazoletransferase [Chloroflexota bacterium]
MGFWAALGFLTILPTPRRAGGGKFARSLVYFPVVGLLIGLLLWGVDLLLRMALPLPLESALLIAVLAVLTGGLHLDGFMDTCDGLGGRDPEHRLAIMKDSRVGAFGVVGALVLLLVKYGALVSLAPPLRAVALVLMPVMGRWSMVLGIVGYPYARAEGLGTAFAGTGRWRQFGLATALAAAMAHFATHWAGLSTWTGLATLSGVALVAWCAATFLKRKLTGLTGDSYGALGELSEVVGLILVLLWQRWTG